MVAWLERWALGSGWVGSDRLTSELDCSDSTMSWDTLAGEELAHHLISKGRAGLGNRDEANVHHQHC